MSAIIFFLIVISLSLLVSRIATVALTLTADVAGGASGVALVAFTALGSKGLFLPAESREREGA